jgi:type I site-specific restriction endonuclease
MAKSAPEMNEAELETRIDEAIRAIFPALAGGRISHQKILKLKLGHQAIEVDGTKAESINGRLDILLELKGTPLAILELKKPGEALDDAVSKQGLSYARLVNHSQLPPLVITSNGETTRFFRTWDGTPWNANNPDEEALQSLFAQAGAVAAENLDQAVQHLSPNVDRSPTKLHRAATRRFNGNHRGP